MVLDLCAIQGTLTLCVSGKFLMGLQWWDAKGPTHGYSGRRLWHADGEAKRMVPGHWTRPTLLSHLSLNLKLSCPFLGPVRTYLSSGDAPLPTSHAADWFLGAMASRQPCGPRNRHSEEHQPPLETSPKFASLPLGRRSWGRDSPFTETSTWANPMKVEFSNKINLLVWSIFCNFC